MANQLAHQINNPLQGLTSLVYLAGTSDPLARLSVLVARLLAVSLSPATQP